MPHLALALLLVAQAAPPPTVAPAPDLSWLAGYWLSCEGGREVAETWSGPRAGVLLGASLTTGPGAESSWELSRIGATEGGRLAFFAQPSGQAATVFPLAASAPNRVVFENPSHDFPQRITYARSGATLTARIEGRLDGRPATMAWRYRSASLNSRCSPRR